MEGHIKLLIWALDPRLEPGTTDVGFRFGFSGFVKKRIKPSLSEEGKMVTDILTEARYTEK